MKICELPLNERPREKLIHYGSELLSNAELIAILLRTGKKGESVLELAQKLLFQFKDLNKLASAEWGEIAAFSGIGLTKAVTLSAAFALAQRLARVNQQEKPQFHSPESVFHFYKDKMALLDRERLVALHLDTKKRLISEEVVSIGTLNASLIHPREVFKKAIKNNADSLILMHNHPSGDPTPSKEDVLITKKLREIGVLLQIPIVDHLIIGQNRYARV